MFILVYLQLIAHDRRLFIKILATTNQYTFIWNNNKAKYQQQNLTDVTFKRIV